MRVLEISRLGLFKGLMPDETEWIRWGTSLTADEPVRPEAPSFELLTRTLSRIRRREFDLIVLPAIHPDHVHMQSKIKLMSKTMLRNAAKIPAVASLVHRLVLRGTRAVIVDVADERHLCATTLKLFPKFALYFKRELDAGEAREPSVEGRVRPIPLILPDERRTSPPREKDIDVMFAGNNFNEPRKRAVEEARSLARRGFRVFIPDKPLPYTAFMEALSRAWIVLSPEGEGWDCYRHYESCLAGSVPLINRASYKRHLYLEDGKHCFYYDADRDSVAERVVALLADKPRLSGMAEEGRRYVLANHTRPAVARYILNELAALPKEPF
jgi:glycosyltransferase involved in cell wall biosynthesis